MRQLRTILYEVERGRARITLNRPEKLNALSFELLTELHDALWEADDDRDVPIDGRELRIRRSPSGSEKLVFSSKDPDVPFPITDGPPPLADREARCSSSHSRVGEERRGG